MNTSKNIVILLVLLWFTSCDIGTYLLVNGNRQLQLVNEGDSITITGRTLDPDIIKIEFNGNYSVYTDSLRLKKRGRPVFDSEIDYYLNHVALKDKQQFSLEGKGVLEIYVRQIPALNYGRIGTIELLPSNFILCNGKPVITDTICFNCEPRKPKK